MEPQWASMVSSAKNEFCLRFNVDSSQCHCVKLVRSENNKGWWIVSVRAKSLVNDHRPTRELQIPVRVDGQIGLLFKAEMAACKDKE
jgi:hypothetical protein